uniref:Uncharacterized protein n=1 Tax=viral metagenome TaxID=1070528 RepID=A0A6C0JIP4_9ZZZZ
MDALMADTLSYSVWTDTFVFANIVDVFVMDALMADTLS